jgi:hypothetical protein
MESTYLFRSLFGRTRISLISAALLVERRYLRSMGQLNGQEIVGVRGDWHDRPAY